MDRDASQGKDIIHFLLAKFRGDLIRRDAVGHEAAPLIFFFINGYVYPFPREAMSTGESRGAGADNGDLFARRFFAFE